ncbi:MAG: hypothetical protein GX088_03975 [Clostridia bacterium]|nr:hypothetical protein [Clostridia bacterium]
MYSSEVKNEVIELREAQELRHQIFKWYLSEWISGSFNNWGDFVQQRKSQFFEKFDNKPMAPEKSLLANNLEYILNRLKELCPNVQKDVLLFFSSKNEKVKPTKVIPEYFQLIHIQYKTLDDSQFFVLA